MSEYPSYPGDGSPQPPQHPGSGAPIYPSGYHGGDAEATAYLPPVPPLPSDPLTDPMSGQPPYGAPHQGPPPYPGQQQPYQQQSAQQQPYQQPYQQHAAPQQPDPRAYAADPAQPPPNSRFGQIHEKYATGEVHLPPQLQNQGQDQGGSAWPENWEQPQRIPGPPAPAPAPAAAPPMAWQPQAAAAPAPPFAQAPGQAPGQPFAEPPAPGYASAPMPAPMPAPRSGPPAPDAMFAPAATGWSDAPVAYAAPTSLRETFASAQPTGPAGAFAQPPLVDQPQQAAPSAPPMAAPVAPPEVQPLAAAPGGSLRQAFASAQPTGPQASAFAGPAPVSPQPAPGRPQPVVRQGSPIIDPGLQPAAATLGLAVLIAVVALLGRTAIVVPVLLLQAVTAAGWFRLNGMWPARQGIALAGLGGLTADAAMLAASGGTAPAVLAGTAGGFFLLVLILQIFKPSNPDERFYALTVSASATLMTVLAGCWTAAVTIGHHGWSTGSVVLVGALSAGAATLVSALPMLRPPLSFAAGAVVALLCGAALGLATGIGPLGALLGLGAGACALVGRRVAGYDFPSRFVHFTAGIALPLTCAAPVVYLLGRLLAG